MRFSHTYLAFALAELASTFVLLLAEAESALLGCVAGDLDAALVKRINEIPVYQKERRQEKREGRAKRTVALPLQPSSLKDMPLHLSVEPHFPTP